ncbi:hypothetical protein AYI68_g2957 [Smittium mucronatum]|uniref:Uncharacterized protein n=1 Tax=Smittium mucronatum TaxID=133383 RepID=A0A1R0H1C5_9FUNG|nr:hypothetical protein AYI68_g2957 [Smittium mucronatum]
MLEAINALTAKVDSLTLERVSGPPEETALTEEEKMEHFIHATRVATALNKTESALYAIQMTLAHGARPIDRFIHRRLQVDPNLTVKVLLVEILNTVRCIIGNVAAMATQSRLEKFAQRNKFYRQSRTGRKIGNQDADGQQYVRSSVSLSQYLQVTKFQKALSRVPAGGRTSELCQNPCNGSELRSC